MMNPQDYIIKFESDTLKYGNVTLRNPFHSGIPEGITAIYGENGSGKSTLGLILEKGRYGFGNRLSFATGSLKVKRLAFTDIHSLSGMEVTYYGQRMEATMNEYVPTVAEIMARRNAPEDWMQKCEAIGLKDVAEKKINYLSSGELRKLLIINALFSEPDLLVLDNPYIGLDAVSRKELDEMLLILRSKKVASVLLVSDISDLPESIDNLIIIDNKTVTSPISNRNKLEELKENINQIETAKEINHLPASAPGANKDYSIAFEIKDGRMIYGDKVIFQDVNWRVGRGERWALQGRNGSGKSLLLSMICADNPQGYSNDITLFDRRRGSGESIFDIKDKIGFVSPEMQLYFKSPDPVLEIVIQGKRNSLNRYQRATDEERSEAMQWLKILEIENLADANFSSLSSGEQRIVLIARALIKQPELLVLDEPFHGLDARRKKKIKAIINEFAASRHTTIIFVTHCLDDIPDCVDRIFTLGE